MPKIIFKSFDHEILSTEGLSYKTGFTKVYKDATHLPSFSEYGIENYYVMVGNECRSFTPGMSVYGFSYQQEDGTWSEPMTAIFCRIGDIEEECVILGNYSQSSADDYWDSLSPYGDVPCGRWDFWSKYPMIFRKNENGQPVIPERLKNLRPDMSRLRFTTRDGVICGYGVDPENGTVGLRPAVATCIRKPGRWIETTLTGLDGQTLLNSFDEVLKKYLSHDTFRRIGREWRDFRIFPVGADGSVNPLAESLLTFGHVRMNPEDDKVIVLAKKAEAL